MDLLIIRHGESEADILKVHEGRADFELTERGNKQAEAMASWVKANFKVDKIMSSPLKRAAKTAGFLSGEFSIPVCFDDDLMEFQNGLIAGLPRDIASQKFPEPKDKFPHTTVYEMESMIQFRMRAENILSKIIYENPHDYTIAVVSHGGMINMLFRSFLQLPVSTDVSIASGDTSVHRWQIDHTAKTRKLIFLNSQVHL